MENNKKKKKRIVIIIAITLCALLLCMGILLFLLNQKKYSLDKSSFAEIVAYNEDVNIESLYIKNDKTGEKIQVQEDMITSCDNTNTIGEKTLLIEYEGFKFAVNFEVKYKVEFIAKNQTINTQFVNGASEIILPENPVVDGYEFIKWDYEIPQELNTNLQFNAVLSSTTLSIPTLKKLSAVYGDTLSDLTLPSNNNGAWMFVDSLTTKVGDCGENEFDVKFVPSTTELIEKTDKVKIEVSQKQLDFEIDSTTFVYDGEPHFPAYTLSEDVNVKVDVLFGEEQTEASETPYQFSYIISDHNYSGYISGTFTITKANVTVNIQDDSINYGTIPQMQYTIDGFDNENILGLSLVYPSSLNAGTYQIGATCTNTNINLTVNKGTLTVNPIYLNPSPVDPTLSSQTTPAVYGDLLSSITFGGAANGVWSWKTPTVTIDKVVGYKAIAVFTPTSANYKIEERELDIVNINKKTLTITSLESQNTYTYDGKAHTITYTIENGEFNHLQVDGVITKTNADTYTTTLVINNEFYQGKTCATLVINKATPITNFKTSYTKTWFNGITLNSIDLDELGNGYSWKTPNYSLDQIKTHIATMVFTPQDTINYLVVEKEISIHINKAQSNIDNVEQSYEFVYSGNKYTLLNIIPSHYEEELVYSYVYENNTVENLLNAGEYNVTITLPESTHYLPCTKTTIVTIEQAEISVVLQTLTAVYEDTLADVVLLSDANGSWTWQQELKTLVGTVGEQKHVAIYTPFNPNYKTVEFTATINVSPKQLHFEITNNEYTYSGEQKVIEYTLTDSQSKDYSYLTVKGNTPYINVGNYNLTLEVENTNYQAKKDTTLIINKLSQTPDIPTNLAATYLDTLSSVTLPTNSKGEWKWLVDENTLVGNAGENKFDAIFVYFEEAGLDNLNDYTTKLSIQVEKYTVQVPTLKQTSVVYDSNPHTAVISGTNANLYTVTPHEFTSVGDYKIELALKDSDNYIWSNGDTQKTYLDFKITKAQAQITNLEMASWTYGNEPSTPNYNYSNFVPSDKVVVAYIDSKNNSTSDIPSASGKYTLKVSIVDTTNYFGDEQSVDFEIFSAVVSIPVLKQNTFVYDGEEHVGEFEDFDGRFYSVSSHSFTDVGEYKIELRLNDTDNYVWENGKSDNVYLDFAITIAQAQILQLDIDSWTYGNEPNTPSVKFSEFVNLQDITIQLVDKNDTQLTQTPTSAGTYKIKLTIASTKNYLGTYGEVTFEIFKAQAKVPTLEKSSFVYDGQAHSASIIDNVSGNSNLYTVTPHSYTNVGEYKVELILKDSNNYIWSNGDEKITELDFAITIATATITTLEIANWIYGAEPSTPNIVYSDFVDSQYVTIEYIDSTSKVLDAKPSTVGTYILKVTISDSANYNGTTKSIEFEILSATVIVPLLEKSTFVYDGLSHTAIVIDNILGNSELYTVTAHSYTNVGEYKVELVLKNSNYVWSNGDTQKTYLDFKITMATAEISTLYVANWTYGNEPSTPNIVYSNFVIDEQVIVEYIDKDLKTISTTPTQAGNYTIKVTIPETENYYGALDSYDFEIYKESIDIPEIKSKSYTGETQKADIAESDYYSVIQNDGGEDYGTYDVVLKINDFVNFKWKGYESQTITLKFEIATAVNEWETYPQIASWTYGNEPSTPVYKETFGTVVITYKAQNANENDYSLTVPSDAGNYVAKFFVLGNQDYNSLSALVEFDIYKAEVVVPSLSQTSAVFNGQTHTATIIDDVVGNSSLYNVTKNGFVDVGKHKVELTLKDNNNYVWSNGNTLKTTLDFEITINQAQITTLEIGDWIYGNTASTQTIVYSDFVDDKDVKLEYIDTKNQSSSNLPSLAGKYTLKVTIASSTNYVGTTATTTFEIFKATVTVPSLEYASFTYDGNPHTPVIVDTDEANKKLYTYAVQAYTNVISTNVELSLVDSANYIWSDGKTEKTHLAFAITVAQAEITKLEIGDWKFNESASTPTIEYSEFVNSNDVTIEYIDKSNKSSSVAPSLVGTYTLKVTIENDANGNYTGTLKSTTFKITSATVIVPTLEETRVEYDGGPHLAVVVDTDEENKKLYTVEELEFTNVGTHLVTLILVDSANYVWSNGDKTTTTLNFVIYQAQAQITTLTAESKPYDGQQVAVNIAYSTFVDAKTVSVVFIDEDNNQSSVAPHLAGSYKIKVTIAGNDNYLGCEKEVPFSITKATVTVPSLQENSVVYDGGPHSAVVEDTDEENKKLYIVAEHSFTNVGIHSITLTLKDSANYVWANGDVISTTLDFSITQETPEITINISEKFTFGTLPSVHSISYSDYVLDSDVTITYTDSKNTVYTELPTQVENYTLTVTIADDANGNYKGITQTATFKITSATVIVPTMQEESVVYDGGPHSAVVVDGDEANKKLYTVEEIEFTNVGEYQITLTLINSVNYVWSNGDLGTTTLSFAITPATPEIIINVANFDYGTSPSVHSISYSDYVFDSDVTITYTDSKNTVYTELPTQAESYTLTVTIADDANGNYTGITQTATFVISKAVVAVPTFTPTSVSYNGITQTASVTLSNLYTITQNGWINVGKYKVEIKLNDKNNYIWSNDSIEFIYLDFEITQAFAQITKLTMDNWIYSQTPKEPVITKSGFVPDEAVVYTYFDTEGNVISKPSGVGSYFVQASIATTNNYVGVTSAKEPFTIDICTPTVTLPNYEKIYFKYNDDEYKKATGRSVLDALGKDITSKGTLTYTAITFAHGTNASTFTVTFTPNDTKNYQTVTKTGNVTVHSAALLGSTYYPTIESAVSKAVSGNTIYVLPDTTGNVIIANDITIISGVTLILLYGSSTSNHNTQDKATVTTTTLATSSNLKTLVVLANSKTITISAGATLEVAGTISGGGGGHAYAGHTAGDYSELRLSANSQIITKGTLKVYGYITEILTGQQTATSGNGSQIIIESGGSVGLPFVVRDFRGGTYMRNVYNKISTYETSTFNQYQFLNINPLLKVNYGGQVYGYANLYAGSVHNFSNIKLVGKTSDFLIQLNNPSYSYLTAKHISTTGKTKLDIYGGMQLNSLNLSIKVLIFFQVNVNTTDVYFPINWAFDVSLNLAKGQTPLTSDTEYNYVLNQKIKIMPGGSLTIGAGAKVNIAKLNVYSNYTDKCSQAPLYPTVYANNTNIGTSGKLTVNGELHCSALGGIVNSDTSGAKIKITTPTLTTYETTGTNKSVGFHDVSEIATLAGVDSVEKDKVYTFNGTTWIAA